MRLRRRRLPRARTIRPAEPYLLAGAEEARRLGHGYVGTEHVLRVLARDVDGAATRLLARLGVVPDAVEQALAARLLESHPAPRIDGDALAALGIDLASVRERLEERFGPGALERTGSGCLGICPRLKLALAHALDLAGGQRLGSEHVLLGLLGVPDSVAAGVLGELGVTREAAEALLDAAA